MPKTQPEAVEAAREAERARRTEAPTGCAVDERSVAMAGAALRMRSFRPEGKGGAECAGLVFFHGGELVAGDPGSHDALCGQLALEVGCVIVSSEYRLAPEHRFPSALDDAYFAACHIHELADEFGIDHRRLGIAGIEAGAGLATGVARLAKERRNPALAVQLLIDPLVDVRSGSGVLEHYADAKTREDARCSPLLAKNLIGLPPVFLVSTPGAPLEAQADAYVERLREAHVPVTRVSVLEECLPALARALAGE